MSFLGELIFVLYNHINNVVLAVSGLDAVVKKHLTSVFWFSHSKYYRRLIGKIKFKNSFSFMSAKYRD